MEKTPEEILEELQTRNFFRMTNTIGIVAMLALLLSLTMAATELMSLNCGENTDRDYGHWNTNGNRHYRGR